MYCKFLKLTNGENLIVSTEDQCDNFDSKSFIEISNPVAIHSMRMPYRNMVVESFIMQPWMKMAKDEVVRIAVNSIIVTANVVEKAEAQYIEFIANYKTMEMSDEGEQLDDQGNNASEEDVLEKFYNMMQNSSEEEEYDEEQISGPTIH